MVGLAPCPAPVTRICDALLSMSRILKVSHAAGRGLVGTVFTQLTAPRVAASCLHAPRQPGTAVLRAQKQLSLMEVAEGRQRGEPVGLPWNEKRWWMEQNQDELALEPNKGRGDALGDGVNLNLVPSLMVCLNFRVCFRPELRRSMTSLQRRSVAAFLAAKCRCCSVCVSGVAHFSHPFSCVTLTHLLCIAEYPTPQNLVCVRMPSRCTAAADAS